MLEIKGIGEKERKNPNLNLGTLDFSSECPQKSLHPSKPQRGASSSLICKRISSLVGSIHFPLTRLSSSSSSDLHLFSRFFDCALEQLLLRLLELSSFRMRKRESLLILLFCLVSSKLFFFSLEGWFVYLKQKEKFGSLLCLVTGLLL